MLAAVVILAALGVTSPDQARQHAADIVSRGGYQTELPADLTSPRGPAEVASAASRPNPAEEVAIGAVGGALRLGPILLAVVVAVALVLAGLHVAQRWHSAAAPRLPALPDEQPGGGRSPGRGAPSPDELARRGRFGEAIHRLLLDAVQEIGRRRTLPASLTVRELLRQLPFGGDGLSALSSLAGQVEYVEFGGRPAERGDYEQALGHYRRFKTAWPTK